MRRMGGLKHLIPMTFALMCVGSFALMGFPFLTGFYSKDAILELYENETEHHLEALFEYWENWAN